MQGRGLQSLCQFCWSVLGTFIMVTVSISIVMGLLLLNSTILSRLLSSMLLLCIVVEATKITNFANLMIQLPNTRQGFAAKRSSNFPEIRGHVEHCEEIGVQEPVCLAHSCLRNFPPLIRWNSRWIN